MALDPKRIAEGVNELIARRTPKQRARIATWLDRISDEGFKDLDLIDPKTGEPIPLPDDCGEEMDRFLDALISRYHATHTST